MDKATFSDSQAAQNLLRILEEPDYIQYRHRVCRVLSRWFWYSGELTTTNLDPTVSKGSLDMWRAHFLKWVDDCNFPHKITTHTKCTIIGRYRWCKKLLDYKATMMAKRLRELDRKGKERAKEREWKTTIQS